MSMQLFPLKKTSTPSSRHHRPGWREYQQSLKQESEKERKRRRFLFLLGLASLLIFTGISTIKFSCRHTRRQANVESPAPTTKKKSPPPNLIDKNSIQVLLDGQSLEASPADNFKIEVGGQPLTVSTTIDSGLQEAIVAKFDRKNSRYIAVVTLSPHDGRVLSMAGFDKDNPEKNPCLDNQFPAASVFKIVTAAAAVERLDYNADSIITFNGYKHTLYKKQLKEQENRYTNKMTFSDSFAQSVNPVFGKIGLLYLKKPVLEEFSAAFGFNKSVDLEIATPPSRMTITDEPYHWAEIASGFNRQTTLTPIHGAMMAAAVINDGKMVQPSIVESVTDRNGKTLYSTDPQIFARPMKNETARIIRGFMEKTITSGTAKKAFRGYQRNKTLAKLDIGGKTGSIFNTTHDLRIDWFVGFAVEKNGDEGIAVSVVVAHEEFIGRRASDYGKLAFTHYFQDYFANIEKNSNSDGKDL